MTQVPAHRRAYAEDTLPPARRSTFQICWLSILLVAVLFRAFTLAQWSWLQDDFIFTNEAGRTGFFAYVFQDVVGGHFLPGGRLITWLITHVAPLDYTWAAVSICALTAAVVVGWGLALRELFGERLHLLAFLLVLVLNPGTTLIAHWWISGILVLPMQAAMGFSVWFLARYLQRGRRRADLVCLNVSYAVGLVMWEKSLFITVPLLFVCLVVESGQGRNPIPAAVRVLWPTALLTAAYLVLYATSGTVTADQPAGYERSLANAARMAGHGAADVLLPSLLGGPFGQPENATSPLPPTNTAVAWVLGVVAVQLLVAGAWFRRRGWLVVVMLLMHTALTWGLLFFSDRYPPFGPQLLASPRYSADLLPVFLLGVAFLCTPLARETDAFRASLPSPTRRRLGVAYLVVVCALLTVTSVRTWTALEPTSPKPYVDTLVAEARSLDRATVYDTSPPTHVMNGMLLGGNALTSVILGPLDLPLLYNEPADDLVMADARGRFSAVEIQGDKNRDPGPVEGCGFLLADVGSRAEIPLVGQLFPYQWIVEISYFSGTDARARVTTDDDAVELDIPSSEPGSIGHRQLVVNGAIATIELELLDGTDVCVTGVRAGKAVPKED